MKYLVFAVIFLHILVSPIIISARADVDTDRMSGRIKVKLFFIPVFVKTVDLNKIKRKIFGERDVQNLEKSEKSENEEKDEKSAPKALKSYLFRVIKIFLARVRVRVIDINGVLGTGDAAVTAVTVGTVGAGYDSARAVMGFDGKCDLRAEYDYERIFVDFYGIISFCLADTIYALIAGGIGSKRKKAVRREVYG